MRAAATSPDSFQLWSTIWYRVRISDARGLFEGTRPEPLPKAHLSLALHSHVCPLLWCGLTRESRIPCARIAARRSSGGSHCLGRPLLWCGSPRESRLSPGAPDPRGAGSHYVSRVRVLASLGVFSMPGPAYGLRWEIYPGRDQRTSAGPLPRDLESVPSAVRPRYRGGTRGERSYIGMDEIGKRGSPARADLHSSARRRL